jgi:hypothetical protein
LRFCGEGLLVISPLVLRKNSYSLQTAEILTFFLTLVLTRKSFFLTTILLDFPLVLLLAVHS